MTWILQPSLLKMLLIHSSLDPAVSHSVSHAEFFGHQTEGTRGWQQRVGTLGRERACEAVDMLSGAQLFSFSCLPPFISLIFILAKRFAGDRKRQCPGNVLEEADFLVMFNEVFENVPEMLPGWRVAMCWAGLEQGLALCFRAMIATAHRDPPVAAHMAPATAWVKAGSLGTFPVL